ncbi:PREDICTED: enhancer of mRNA-decapping protein 4 isoform X2 [Nicrophorus vespilloides]|uniref:Enhancer of mRNA-decapping protein 4 isoform X2 n=1 Tax=Nicrophorus vespilloides TaxID=110193 RepID=A0ABM1NES9_NICVS|nr:PREDICTED: enhancer of mRNA-decapping protein 4 isoform X2 [Nicrophorus vespilloides]
MMGSNSLGSKANFSQTIHFKGSETEYSAEVVAQDVTINCSKGDHRNGSSKVKLKNLVDYNWELKYHIGQLIACHVNGKHYAYTLKPKGKLGMFRVVNMETDERVLIKDFKGTIQDISFALTPQVILGCVDENGNLVVYTVDSKGNQLECNLLLHVNHSNPDPTCGNYRVIWCPYVPTYGENSDTVDDPAKLLVLLNGSKAEVWDVSLVNAKYGTGTYLEIAPNEEYDGYVEIDGHCMDIIDASFSPDGTALATASLDGYVKFFQVYMIESEDPRCLHQWQPHDGKALSCLLFLDNVKSYALTDSKFWKFAITGANYNAEMKIWSCESWTCLQTIRFEPSPHSVIPNLFLKVTLDMSAEYLLMSDINNRILYTLQIQKNEEERTASVSTISEFLLPSSFLSFCIVNVSETNLRNSNSSEDLYDDDQEDYEDETSLTAIAMKMIVVQPKSLQECTVTFKPEGSMASNLKSVYGNVLENNESEVNEIDENLPKFNDLESSLNRLLQKGDYQQQSSINLSPECNSPVLNSSPTALIALVKKENNAVLIDFQQPQKDNCASGGSSPSREVQEILSLNNPSTHVVQEYFDNLKLSDTEATVLPTNDYAANDEAEAPKTDAWPNMVMAKAIEIELNRRKEQTDEDSTKIKDLSYRMKSMEDILKEQTKLIQSLQQEIKIQNGKKSNEYDIRNVFVKELDTALSKHTSKMFTGFAEEQKRKEREQYDKLVNSVTQTINKSICDNLQTIITHDIKVNVLPSILSIFEELQMQLDVQYSQKLHLIDQLLKTNIAKLFNKASVAESLSSSVINVIKPSLDNCYKEMIGTTLIPSWERVCHTMFQQIHNTFTQGTKEYTSSVEMYMDRQRKVQDKGKDLINQMQTVSESMKSHTEKLSSHISEDMQKQINIAFNNMQERMTDRITEVVKEQVKIGFRTHAAVLEDSVVNAVRSRAVTPSPHVIDTQAQLTQINNLLMKGNIDTAFQQALSASATSNDLTLVLHICENIKPQDIFGMNNCILQQHVLLSLVQQLGTDISSHTEIKIRYLEEAILNLETYNQMTKDHVPNILKELSKQLTLFISNKPSHKLITNMRMLVFIINSMIGN